MHNVSMWRCCRTSILIFILKMIWSHESRIFIMRFPLPVETIFILEWGSGSKACLHMHHFLCPWKRPFLHGWYVHVKSNATFWTALGCSFCFEFDALSPCMGLLPDTQNCGCACAGNAGNVFPVTAGKRSRHASRHVRHARAVMHAGIAN